MPERTYNTTEVARLTGFSVRQLEYWANQQVVVPSVRNGRGKGSKKLYAASDLVQFRFIRRLKTQGWSTQKIRLALQTLREVMDDANPLKSAVVFGAKNTILALCKTKAGERILLDSLNPKGQQVMMIVLEVLVAEVVASETKLNETPQLAEVA